MRAPRRIASLIASLALTAALALGLLWAAQQQGSDKEGAGAAAQPTPAPIAGASPAVSPVPLPPAAPGYTWFVTPPNDVGLPLYAVQVPSTWSAPGSFYGNPISFSPQDYPVDPEAGPKLLTMVIPASAGFEHPILFNLPQMGTTCGSGVPRGQMPGSSPDASDTPPANRFSGDAFTWDVYYFTCETRVTAAQEVATGARPTPFDVRAGEVRVGEFIFSITALEPRGSGASQTAFEQALRTFRQQ